MIAVVQNWRYELLLLQNCPILAACLRPPRGNLLLLVQTEPNRPDHICPNTPTSTSLYCVNAFVLLAKSGNFAKCSAARDMFTPKISGNGKLADFCGGIAKLADTGAHTGRWLNVRLLRRTMQYGAASGHFHADANVMTERRKREDKY